MKIRFGGGGVNAGYKHDNQIKEYLRFFSRVAEMRIPTIAQSKKLTRAVEQMMNP